MKLDRSKPFGQSYGVGIAYTYVQDGRFFRADDVEINELGGVKRKPRKKTKIVTDVD